MSRMATAFAKALVLTCCAGPITFTNAQTITVTGAVWHPGEFEWRPGARLLGASTAAQVMQDAWYQGASLLRISAIKDQRKLKRGLQFDLSSAIVQGRANSSPATVELLQHWSQRIQDMPVTGRIPAELNPLKQWLISSNPLLEPGDKIIYTRRPNYIKVVGAVLKDCTLPFSPARTPTDYLRDCPIHEAADLNHLFLIQPDGNAQRIGSAYWNAEVASTAVGALIYVPIDPTIFGTSSGDFNQQMAEWLATQQSMGSGYSE